MITITLLSLCFLTALSCRIKKVKAPVIRTLTWYFHLLFLFLSVICLFLMLNNYGFKGTQTERVFFTLYAGTGMLLFGLTPPGNDARYAYLLCFFGFPFVLLLGLLLPPLRTLTLIAGITLLSDSDFQRFNIDHDFTLQTKTTGILSAYPQYSLVEDKYLLFEKITPDVISPRAPLRALKMSKQGTDSVRIQLRSTRNRMDTTLLMKR
ncbi:hypothetical protein [Chitinophaga nivalis]|uniref:Uncharacterized protein n=1 Tax=Chitinophaga nivalis TaxID=2991709 RepID=A0ABT3IRB9_9BACT|nr:hypothetical protein [Chitinophaga nivalis]MCW3463810.1 hypothetical protein [Chitinophaga nivalis]MCW3486500.1 hypothetical protein [Chitinophaga nivalis]